MQHAPDSPGAMDVSEAELQGLYTWVDEIPLSRPKRNIARDFSDGVLMAEVVHHYFPKLVELHNYSSANSTQQKLYNWSTLNNKVLKRLGFSISKPDVDAISNCVPGSIERCLKLVKIKIAKFREEGGVPLPAPTGLPRVAQLADSGHHHYDQGMDHAPVAPVQVAAPVMVAAPRNNSGGGVTKAASKGVPPEVLAERDQAIAELRETNEILETKVRKLEQLVRLKDAKISTLMAKLQAAGLA